MGLFTHHKATTPLRSDEHHHTNSYLIREATFWGWVRVDAPPVLRSLPIHRLGTLPARVAGYSQPVERSDHGPRTGGLVAY
jgi:hypothetical protein